MSEAITSAALAHQIGGVTMNRPIVQRLELVDAGSGHESPMAANEDSPARIEQAAITRSGLADYPSRRPNDDPVALGRTDETACAQFRGSKMKEPHGGNVWARRPALEIFANRRAA
jgi:hypothetical protein